MQTNAFLAKDHGLRRNISVTATTAFDALWHADSECWVHVTHANASDAKAGSHLPSRVRLDSIAIMTKFSLAHSSKMFAMKGKYRAGFRAVEQAVTCDRQRYARACAKEGAHTAERKGFCEGFLKINVTTGASIARTQQQHRPVLAKPKLSEKRAPLLKQPAPQNNPRAHLP